MTDKEATISKVYHDPAGFGSITNTLRDAQAIDKTIKINHVKEFFKTMSSRRRDTKAPTAS